MRKSFLYVVLVVLLAVTSAASAEDLQADVVVVGAGGAGLTAAIEASLAGANVIVLEKMSFPGGNTLISGGIWNVPNTWLQQEAGINDSIPLHVGDTLVGGDYLADPALVGVMIEEAAQATEWFIEVVGLPKEDIDLTVLGGHSVPRGLFSARAGVALIEALVGKATDLGVEILYNTEAVALLTDDMGAVTGVQALSNNQETVIGANTAVVLATGGFGANVEMRKDYNPKFDEGYLTTNQPYITGEGILMANAVGADLVDMEQIQAFPMCDPETGDLNYPVSYARNEGAILVNQEGHRYVEELERRDVISEATLAQTAGHGYVLWGAEIGHHMTFSQQAQSLMDRGLLYEADTIEEAADFFGISADTLVATVEQYNEFIANGQDPDFGRRDIATAPTIETGSYWIGQFVPSVHHTMGGVVIDTEARVLAANGQPIVGLYAAGEVTGGIHGANRLGGNALTDVLVFGRIAGQNAAEGK